MVLSVNVKALAEKGNLDKWEELEFMQAFEEELSNESNRLARRIERVKEDPASAGMDLRKDVYVFTGGEKSSENYTGIAIDMLDKDDFEEFVKGILEESDIYFEHKKVNDYRVFLIRRNDAAIIYDRTRILFLIPTGYKHTRTDVIDIIKDLTALGSRNQLLRNKDFKDFLSNTSDAGVWVSGSFAKSSLSRRELRQINEQLGYDVTDNSFATHLTFGRNDIALSSRGYLGQDSQNFLAQWNLVSRTVDSDLLEFLPGDAAVAAGVSFDMENIRTALEQEERLEEFMDEIKSDESSEAAFEAFNGDFVFDFYGFKEVEETYTDYETFRDSLGFRDYREVEKTRIERSPMLALAIGLEDPRDFRTLLRRFEKENDPMNENVDLGYVIVDGPTGELYVGHKKEHALISSDEDLVKAYMKGGTIRNQLADTDIGDEIDDQAFYAMVDLDADRFKAEIEEEFGDQADDIAGLADDFFKRLVINTEEQNLNVVLEIHPGKGNSLWRLIQLIDEGYQESQSR